MCGLIGAPAAPRATSISASAANAGRIPASRPPAAQAEARRRLRRFMSCHGSNRNPRARFGAAAVERLPWSAMAPEVEQQAEDDHRNRRHRGVEQPLPQDLRLGLLPVHEFAALRAAY